MLALALAAAHAAEPSPRDEIRAQIEAHVDERIGQAFAATHADAAQQGRVLALVAELRERRDAFREEGRALRGRLRGLLLAPEIDPDAVEDVREEVVDLFDRATEVGFGTLVSIAQVFTPEQRATLAAHRPDGE